MDNFFNNGPTFLKSTVGIRIYHILITSRKKYKPTKQNIRHVLSMYMALYHEPQGNPI
jgi:hypothetical protein